MQVLLFHLDSGDSVSFWGKKCNICCTQLFILILNCLSLSWKGHVSLVRLKFECKLQLLPGIPVSLVKVVFLSQVLTLSPLPSLPPLSSYLSGPTAKSKLLLACVFFSSLFSLQILQDRKQRKILGIGIKGSPARKEKAALMRKQEEAVKDRRKALRSLGEWQRKDLTYRHKTETWTAINTQPRSCCWR